MVKRIYLLRSARPRGGEDGTLADYHRPLTRRSESAAIRIGKLMQKKGYLPDLAICATPTRARQTLACVWPSLLRKPVLIHDSRLHLMRGEELLTRLQQADATCSNILLVGKSPGITELARLLYRPPSSGASAAFTTEMPPCSLAVFECDLASWAELAPACAKLIGIEAPLGL